MKNVIQGIPTVLQHAILIRAGLSLVNLLAAACLFLCFNQLLVVAPFLLLAPVLAGHAAYIYWLFIKGHCLELRGTVLGVERSFLRSKPKALLLEIQGVALRVILFNRLKVPKAGGTVLIYISDTTPLFEWRGMHQLDSYLAIAMDESQPGCPEFKE